jgi:hypothetical protein
MSEGISAYSHGAEKRDAANKPEKKKVRGLRAIMMALGVVGAGAGAYEIMTAPEAPVASNAFSERERAADELARSGITNHQRGAYREHLSEALARGWYPVGYRGADLGTVLDVGFSVGTGALIDTNAQKLRDFDTRTDFGQVSGTLEQQREHARLNFKHRLDAWYMYLGLPQKYGTFGISEYRPNRSTSDQYYYRIQSFSEDVAREESDANPGSRRTPFEVLHDLIATEGDGRSAIVYDRYSGVMGNFTISMGEDERGRYIGVWDLWDLTESPEGEEGIVGRPYEIYDRIYEEDNRS